MNPIKFSILFSLFSALFFLPSGNSQTILNGDFENHSLDTCFLNMENDVFNEAIENVFAFGTESLMDLLNDSCTTHPIISNAWFASMSQRPSGPFDEFSLEIDQPLVEGMMYELSYFERADTSSNPFSFNTNMPLEIGLSMDTFSFGEMIYSSIPEPDVWTLRTFEFTAPNNGRFITVRMAGDLGLKGWNLVDDFRLGPATDVEEASKMEVHIYPNPARDYVFIEAKMGMESVRLFNAMGQEVKFFRSGEANARLDMRGLSAGIYFLEMLNNEGRVVKRIEKI